MTLSGRKIVAFAGREHHVQRLDGIMQALTTAGANAFYVCSDNSIQIDIPAVTLVQAGKPFVHAMSYFPSGQSGNVMGQTAEVLGSIGGEWQQNIQSYVDPFWLAHSVHEACEYLLCFGNLLDKEKPDLVMVLHSANFWTLGLAYLCSKRGIPVVAFQEGRMRHRDQETQGKQSLAAEYVSHLCVWSESSRDAYLRAGVAPEKLHVTGIPHLDPWLKNKRAKMGKLVAFCPPLASRYEGDLGKAISQLADWALNSRITLAIRLHPFDNIADQVRQGLGSHPYAHVVEEDVLSLIASSDLVISQHSTVAVEALALNVPVAELDLDSAGVLEALSPEGVAISVGPGELGKLNQLLDGKIAFANLQEWQAKHLGPLDGGSVQRVVDVIEGILA
jgi:hypothetical protein